jgi:hypothetical protein
MSSESTRQRSGAMRSRCTSVVLRCVGLSALCSYRAELGARTCKRLPAGRSHRDWTGKAIATGRAQSPHPPTTGTLSLWTRAVDCLRLQITCLACDGGGWIFSGSADSSIRAWRLRSDASWESSQVSCAVPSAPDGRCRCSRRRVPTLSRTRRAIDVRRCMPSGNGYCHRQAGRQAGRKPSAPGAVATWRSSHLAQ